MNKIKVKLKIYGWFASIGATHYYGDLSWTDEKGRRYLEEQIKHPMTRSLLKSLIKKHRHIYAEGVAEMYIKQEQRAFELGKDDHRFNTAEEVETYVRKNLSKWFSNPELVELEVEIL